MTRKTVWTINSLATAGVALFFTQVVHEAVHLLAALVVGVEVRAFNLFAVDTRLYRDGIHMFEDIAVEASASLVNILIGLAAAIAVMVRGRSRAKPWRYPLAGQFVLQLAGFSLLMGFGYLLFDGAFYVPGAYGDWKSIIGMVERSGLLRLLLVILGSAGTVGTFFLLAGGTLQFVPDAGSTDDLRGVSKTLLLIPWLVFSTLYTGLALFHPLGFPEGAIIVFLQFFFGFSGFLWGHLLCSRWLTPGKIDFPSPLPDRLGIPWIVPAVGLLAVQVFILLPTISW